MKKTLIAAAVLVAALLLLGPYALGRFAEQRSDAVTEVLVEQMPYLSVVERSWERGWFTSRQRLVFEVREAGGGERERYTVHNDVLHGPVLGLSGIGAARVKTRLELPAEAADEIRDIFGPEPALQVTTRIGLTGGGSTMLRSPGRTLAITGGAGDLEYETATVTVDFSRDLSRYEVDGRLPQLEVRRPDGQRMVVERISMEGDGRRVEGFEHLYDSEFEMAARELAVDRAGGALRIGNLRYAADIDTEDGFTEMSFEAGSGEVESPELAGYDIAVRSVHYAVALEQLHAPTVDAFYTSMQQVSDHLPAADAADPAAADEAMRIGFFEPLMMHVGAVIERGARLSFRRIGFSTQHGDATLTGTITAPGMTEQQFQSEGMAGLIGRLDAEFNFEIALALAQRVPNGEMLTGPGIASGYLVQQDDKLVARIQYQSGRLTVNGQTGAVPLPGLVPADPALAPEPGTVPQPDLDVQVPPRPGA